MKIKKKIIRLSKYVSLVVKTVFFKKKQIFHSFKQNDYVSILAYTKNKKFLLVKQYRPAIEKFTLEIPGGLVDKREKPINAAKRELKEETGYYAKKVEHLGSFYVDVGRLENKIHCYFAKNLIISKDFNKEPDLEIIEVNLYEFSNLIRQKKIIHFLHVGIVGLAKLKNLINIKI
jgi:8-oxo-dGTP pyrophosphatase MutT (NUDIX family)